MTAKGGDIGSKRGGIDSKRGDGYSCSLYIYIWNPIFYFISIAKLLESKRRDLWVLIEWMLSKRWDLWRLTNWTHCDVRAVCWCEIARGKRIFKFVLSVNCILWERMGTRCEELIDMQWWNKRVVSGIATLKRQLMKLTSIILAGTSFQSPFVLHSSEVEAMELWNSERDMANSKNWNVREIWFGDGVLCG